MQESPEIGAHGDDKDDGIGEDDEDDTQDSNDDEDPDLPNDQKEKHPPSFALVGALLHIRICWLTVFKFVPYRC